MHAIDAEERCEEVERGGRMAFKYTPPHIRLKLKKNCSPISNLKSGNQIEEIILSLKKRS